MTPLPDNFSSQLFAARCGTDALDRAHRAADEAVAATVELNRQAAAILARAKAEIIALGDFEWMAKGYDLVDAMDLLTDIAPSPTDPKLVERITTQERDRREAIL